MFHVLIDPPVVFRVPCFVFCRGPAHHSAGVRIPSSYNDVYHLQTPEEPAVRVEHVDSSRGHLFRGVTYLRLGKAVITVLVAITYVSRVSDSPCAS